MAVLSIQLHSVIFHIRIINSTIKYQRRLRGNRVYGFLLFHLTQFLNLLNKDTSTCGSAQKGIARCINSEKGFRYFIPNKLICFHALARKRKSSEYCSVHARQNSTGCWKKTDDPKNLSLIHYWSNCYELGCG